MEKEILATGNPALVFGQGLVEALFGGGVAGVVVRGGKCRGREAATAAAKPPGLNTSTVWGGPLINTVTLARCFGIRAPASRFNGFPSAATNRSDGSAVSQTPPHGAEAAVLMIGSPQFHGWPCAPPRRL